MENFTGNENKGFLWSFFNEQKLFDGINVKFKDDIKSLFERTIEYVSRQKQLNTLADKNKETIRIMVSKLGEFKQQSYTPAQSQSQSQITQQNINTLRSKGIYNSSDIQEERQRKIDSEFQRKKNEFESITPKKPETIDFTDKNIDSPIGEDNIDALIAKTIAMREQQLNQIMDFQEPAKAAEWIGASINATTGTTNVVNLKIGKETALPDKQIVDLEQVISKPKMSPINKQVSFSNNNEIYTFSDNINQEVDSEQSVFSANNINSFFSKLKKNDKTLLEDSSTQGQESSSSAHGKEKSQKIQNTDIYNNEILNINKKIDLLNEKIDKILEQQTIILSKLI